MRILVLFVVATLVVLADSMSHVFSQSDIDGKTRVDANKPAIYTETLDRDGGCNYKDSNLDSGIVLASIHTLGSDRLFGPSDDRVLAKFIPRQKPHQQRKPSNC